MSAFTKSIEALTGMEFDAAEVARIDEFASCNLFARKQLRDEYLMLAVAAITQSPNVKGQPWIDPRKEHEANALIESRALAIPPCGQLRAAPSLRQALIAAQCALLLIEQGLAAGIGPSAQPARSHQSARAARKSARARSPRHEKATADSSKRPRRKPTRSIARKAVRS